MARKRAAVIIGAFLRGNRDTMARPMLFSDAERREDEIQNVIGRGLAG